MTLAGIISEQVLLREIHEDNLDDPIRKNARFTLRSVVRIMFWLHRLLAPLARLGKAASV